MDPDFFTPLAEPAKKLATSISGKNVITVDVSADAFNSNVDAGMAERAIQQLVYTATAAAASAGLIDSGQQIQVVVLVDGHTDYVAFDHVRLGAPTSRDGRMVAPVWIIDPPGGAHVRRRRVKIIRPQHRPGSASSAGRSCGWPTAMTRSPRASWSESARSPPMQPAGQSGDSRSAQKLDPGTYEVRVSQSRRSGRTQERQTSGQQGLHVK